MSPRLNRGEYWLLLQAALHNIPLPTLFHINVPGWDPGFNPTLNSMSHGMSPEETARTLQRLSRRGWLNLAYPFRQSGTAACDDINTLVAEMRHGKNWKDQLSYHLTPEGGAAWEQFACPDWDCYVDDTTSDSDANPMERCVIMTTRKELERQVGRIRHEVDVVDSSIEIDEMADWEMTYWKPPRMAWRCGLLYRERPFEGRPIFPRASNWWHSWCAWR
ncbi:MAG: hypothetical protein ABI411_18120 [Tahibacter sp.]